MIHRIDLDKFGIGRACTQCCGVVVGDLQIVAAVYDQQRHIRGSRELCRVMRHQIDHEALHRRCEQAAQQWVKRLDIDPAPGLEFRDRRIDTLEQRSVCGVGVQLLAQHRAHGPPGCRNKDHPAQIVEFLRRGQRHDRALAMAKQPDAIDRDLRARRFDPARRIRDVIRDRHGIGIGGRCLAAEHAALVDPQRPDATLLQRIRKQAIGRRGDRERVVAIAVGHARSRNDQHQRMIGLGRNQRTCKFALRPRSGERLLCGCWRSEARKQRSN